MLKLNIKEEFNNFIADVGYFLRESKDQFWFIFVGVIFTTLIQVLIFLGCKALGYAPPTGLNRAVTPICSGLMSGLIIMTIKTKLHLQINKKVRFVLTTTFIFIVLSMLLISLLEIRFNHDITLRQQNPYLILYALNLGLLVGTLSYATIVYNIGNILNHPPRDGFNEVAGEQADKNRGQPTLNNPDPRL